MRISRLAALAWLGFAPVASAQDTLFKDRFLYSRQAGTLGLLKDEVESLAASKSLIVLNRNQTIDFSHRKKCIVAIAHRDLDQKNLETFVGIQLIKVYKQHDTPGVVHVHRNDGWFDPDGKRLGVTAGEVMAPGVADFAEAHHFPPDLNGLTLIDGKRTLSGAWHALVTSKSGPYSADQEHARFWRVDPLSASNFRNAHPELFGKGELAVRIDNRLLRFTLTDSSNPINMPTFNFDCHDALLDLVAIRTYLPFASESGWAYIRFR